MPFVALTETTGTTTLVDAMISSFTTMVGDMMSIVTRVLPVVLPLLGATLIIGFGIKIFKKVTGKA